MTNDDDLGDDLERVVADLVKEGRYPSRTALLREGVRLVEEREALRGLTPYQYVARIWTKDPGRFKINPYHHTTGSNS